MNIELLKCPKCLYLLDSDDVDKLYRESPFFNLAHIQCPKCRTEPEITSIDVQGFADIYREWHRLGGRATRLMLDAATAKAAGRDARARTLDSRRRVIEDGIATLRSRGNL